MLVLNKLSQTYFTKASPTVLFQFEMPVPVMNGRQVQTVVVSLGHEHRVSYESKFRHNINVRIFAQPVETRKMQNPKLKVVAELM